MKTFTLSSLEEPCITSYVLDNEEYEEWLTGDRSFETISVYDIWFGNPKDKKFTMISNQAYEDRDVMLIPISKYHIFLLQDATKSQPHTEKKKPTS